MGVGTLLAKISGLLEAECEMVAGAEVRGL